MKKILMILVLLGLLPVAISNADLGDNVRDGTPYISGLTPQGLWIAPLDIQTITSANSPIQTAGYSNIHISGTTDILTGVTPSITGGVEGQVIYIYNQGEYDVTLQDNSTLSGSSVFLGHATGTIHAGATILLVYDSAVSGYRVYSNPNTAAAGATAEVITVRNISGSAIAAGKGVYITGWNNGHAAATVDLADADDPDKMDAIGISAEVIANGSNGDVILSGNVIGLINTSTASVNDGVWIGTTAGSVVFTRPTVDAIQKIGIVTRSKASGNIMVIGAGRENDVPITVIAAALNLTGKSGASIEQVDNSSGASVYTIDATGAHVITPTLSTNVVNKDFVENRMDTTVINVGIGGVSKYYSNPTSGGTITGKALGGGIIYWDSTVMGGVTAPAVSGDTPFFVLKDNMNAGVTLFTENNKPIQMDGEWGTKLWVPPGNLGHQVALTHSISGATPTGYWDVIGNIGANWTLE